MDTGKEQIHEDRRRERAKDVKIQFTTPNDFIVLDEEGNEKYNGTVSEDGTKDNCGCKSFVENNTAKYEASHATPFQCKHLIKAREVRFGGQLRCMFIGCGFYTLSPDDYLDHTQAHREGKL